MISIENLSFRYSRRQKSGLKDLSLRFRPGSICGLLGRNGAGKSTLLYLMSGLLRPESGRVMLDGVDVARRDASTLSKIYIVPEEFDLPPVTFARYVELNAGFYPNFSIDDLRRHLDTMEMDYDVNLGELSMGQKKKALMCFALACNTEILLMDEPTNGLDIPSKSAFRRFIVSGANDDRVILISTHQVKDIDKILDHLIIMNDGRIVLDRSVASLTSRLDFRVSPEAVTDVLYCRRGLGGYDIIARNDSGEYSDLNLETLFELASENERVLIDALGTDADDERDADGKRKEDEL